MSPARHWIGDNIAKNHRLLCTNHIPERPFASGTYKSNFRRSAAAKGRREELLEGRDVNGVCGADLSVLFPGGQKQLSWRDFGGTSRKGNKDTLPTPVASNGDNKSAVFMASG